MKNLNVRNEETNRKGGKGVKKKWLVGLLAFMLLFSCVSIAMSSVAHAAFASVTIDDKLTLSCDSDVKDFVGISVKASWTHSNGTVTGSCEGNRAISMYMTNLTDQALSVSFKYTVAIENGGTVSIASDKITESNTEAISKTVIVESGTPLEIKLTGTNYKHNVGIIISDITVQDASTKISVTLKQVARDENNTGMGSYTAQIGTGTVTTVSDSDVSIEVTAQDTVALNASPAGQNKWYRWKISDESGTTYSFDQSYPLTSITKATTIEAEFLSPNFNIIYGVDGGYYYSWEDAMQAASDGSVVVLMDDYELPATYTAAEAVGEKAGDDCTYVKVDGDNLIYTVPENVTFLIPYGDDDTQTDLLGGGLIETGSNPVAGTAARTLTVPNGATIEVKGNFVVNAKRMTKTGDCPQGCTSGDYGKLILGGTMNIKNGATLISRGYIVDSNHTSHSYQNGTGRLKAESGSTVKVLFQIINHRGGSATSGVVSKVVPINNFSIANIMVFTEYEYGAVLKAAYQVTYSKSGEIVSTTGEVTLLTNDSSAATLFQMESGSSVVMDYDYLKDQTIAVVQEGNVKLKNIKIQMTVNIIVDIPINVDTANVQLPVADNIKVYVGSPDGTSTAAAADLTYSTKMLPGTEIHVMKNGTLNVNHSLFSYAYGTDTNKDYKDTWSDDKLRTRLNIAEVSQQGTRVIPKTDSKVYVYGGGTVNLGGEFGQSLQATDAICIAEEGATLIVSTNALNAPTTTIYEAPDVSDTAVQVTDWTGTKGRLAGVSTAEEPYKLFSTEGVGAGTYKSVKIDGELYWYKYAVTYKIGEEEVAKQYVCVDNTTLNATNDLAAWETGDQRYVITGATAVTTGDGTVTLNRGTDSENELIKDGWEDLTLTGIDGDVTVKLTVAPYQYRVEYTENGTTYPVEYVDSAKYIKTWDTTPMKIEPSFTNWEGTSSTVAWEQDEGENKTTFTADLTDDTKMNLTTESDVWKVVYEIKNVDGTTISDSAYVTKGEDWTYNVTQPDDSWLIIEDDDVTVTGTRSGVENSDTAYTVKGVGSNLSVKIELTAYDRKIMFSLIPVGSTDSSSVQIPYRYINGTGTSASYTEITAGDGKKYIFQIADAVTCTGATASATKETLTVSNATEKSVTVEATVVPYDAIITIIQNGNNEVLKDYYQSGAVASWDFGANVKIDSVTPVEAGYTNPTIDADGNVTNAQVSYTVGTQDVTLNVNTSTFKYILTVDDGVNPAQTKYTDSTTYTYTCAPYFYITDATSTSGTVSGIGTEELKVTGISGNATIKITLTQFARRVRWYNVDGNATLKTTYLETIPAGGATDSYTCTGRQVAWAKDKVGDFTASPTGVGETIEASGIMGKTAAEDKNGTNEAVEIGLKLYDYDYKVTFTDGTNDTVFYVKGDKSVFDNADILYTAKPNKYVSAYSLLDSEGNELPEDKKPTVLAAGDKEAEVKSVMNGYRYLKLTGVESDVMVKLTLADYDYKVIWNVNINVAGTESKSTELRYITGDTDTCTIDSKYTITNVETNEGTATYNQNVATVTDLEADAEVTVTAQDYKYKITWIVDGVEQEPTTTNEDTVVWTLPDRTDDKTYVVVNVEWDEKTGTVDFTNKTVTVTPKSDMTVKITTEEALTNWKALWGNMSFRYYKNAAYYGWDGEAYTWRLIEEYAWTHKSGSMIHTYADLEKVGEITSYTVPNGSVMIVNPTNQKIKATVTIQMDASTEYWKDTPVVTLTAADEAGTTGTTTITVYLDAHETLLISATLTGTPQDGLTDQATGSCSVKIEPID